MIKALIEFFEILFRSFRQSDKDYEIMIKKGYGFDADKGRFVK